MLLPVRLFRTLGHARPPPRSDHSAIQIATILFIRVLFRSANDAYNELDVSQPRKAGAEDVLAVQMGHFTPWRMDSNGGSAESLLALRASAIVSSSPHRTIALAHMR